jgi:hypothetical protein
MLTTSTLIFRSRRQIFRVASLWPVAAVAYADLHYICIKKTCCEYEVGGGSIIRTNRDPPPIYTNNIHSTLGPRGRYQGQGVAASLWPVAAVAHADLHCICIKKTSDEYEVDEMPQS